MERYYVTKEPAPSGMREVHRQGCQHVPQEGERVLLGICNTSNEAVVRAQNLFRGACPCECCLDQAITSPQPPQSAKRVDKASKSMPQVVVY